MIFQREEEVAKLIEGRDVDWHGFQYGVEPADCVPVEGNHPAYILYTSGTTGAPKGVIRHTGGHLVALNWSMKNIYNVDPGDTFWAASDVGWVVGHSYICYAPLIHGNTTIVFEGKPVGTPDAGTFWRVISDHKVRSFFTAPTAFRAVKRDDPKGEFLEKYDLSCLRAIYLAGERADPDTIEWAMNVTGKPVVIIGGRPKPAGPLQACLRGSRNCRSRSDPPRWPMPGYDVQILDEAGYQMKPGELGAIAIELPLPPGTLPTLWNAEHRFRKSTCRISPAITKPAMRAHDRRRRIPLHPGAAPVVAVIALAGHRLSTGGAEESNAGGTSRRGRMRGDRCGGPAQGATADGVCLSLPEVAEPSALRIPHGHL